MKQVLFNPIYDKFPRGGSMEGEEVTFTLRLSHSLRYQKVEISLINDKTGERSWFEMQKADEDDNFATYQFTKKFEAGIFWYHFELMYYGEKTYIVQNEDFDSELSQTLTTSFAQIVAKKSHINYSKGVIYHIFVDRFCKSGKVKVREPLIERKDWGGAIQKNTTDPIKINQEAFCGNLQGVIDKLDYIKSLGTDMIYLSPIFSSNSYHKYDTADYTQVDEMFGGNETFQKLIDEAKKRGIDILLDGVFNHTGSDSIYFNKEKRFSGDEGAYNSKKSKYFDWFNFERWPDKYESWWGILTLPCVNEDCEEYLDFIAGKGGIIEKYMKMGIKGFRLDVADELSNHFLHKIEHRIKEFGSDKLVIGEVWEDAAIKSSYGVRKNYFTSGILDGVMNYPLKNGILSYIETKNEKELVRNMYALLDHYPKNAQYNQMNIIGSHDSRRIATLIEEITKDKEEQFKLLQIATLLQYGFIGNPALFYADERGAKGGRAPLSRVCFPWEKVDTREEKWYKLLGSLRKSPILKKGNFNLLFADDGVVVFEREYNGDKMIFATNLSSDDFEISLKSAKDMLTGKTAIGEYIVKANNFAILKVKGENK